MVKNLPVNAGDAGDISCILGSERPLEEEMATHNSILAWKSYGQRSLVGYSPWGCKELVETDHTYTHTHTHIYDMVQGLPW